MLGDRQAIAPRADARRCEAERRRIEDAAGLRIEDCEVGARAVPQRVRVNGLARENTMNKKSETPLTDAATLIEAELSRFERLLQDLAKPVSSEKALQRAGGLQPDSTGPAERVRGRSPIAGVVACHID